MTTTPTPLGTPSPALAAWIAALAEHTAPIPPDDDVSLTDSERLAILATQHQTRRDNQLRHEAKAQALRDIADAQALLGLTAPTPPADLRRRLDAFRQWLSDEYEAAADAAHDEDGSVVSPALFIRADLFHQALFDARRAQRTTWLKERYRSVEWGTPEAAQAAAHARAEALRARHWQVVVSEIRGWGTPIYGVDAAAPMQPMPALSAPERIVRPQPAAEEVTPCDC